MFFGDNQEVSEGVSFKRYTGATTLKALIANPSNEQYKAMTGNELPFELKYEQKNQKDGKGKYCINKILCQIVKAPDTYVFIDLIVGDYDNVFESNGVQMFCVVNKHGEVSTPCSNIADAKYYGKEMRAKDKARKLKAGEDELIDFVKCLARVNLKFKDSNGKEAEFLVDMKNAGITCDALSKGNVAGLNKMINYYKQNEVAAILDIRKDEQGKCFQSVVNRFGQVGVKYDEAAFVSRLRKEHEYVNPKNGKSYPITKNLFTWEFMEFDESKCMNNTSSSSNSLGSDSHFSTIINDNPFSGAGNNNTPEDDLPF